MSKTANRVELFPSAGTAPTFRNLEIFNSNLFRCKATSSPKLMIAKAAPVLAWLGNRSVSTIMLIHRKQWRNCIKLKLITLPIQASADDAFVLISFSDDVDLQRDRFVLNTSRFRKVRAIPALGKNLPGWLFWTPGRTLFFTENALQLQKFLKSPRNWYQWKEEHQAKR